MRPHIYVCPLKDEERIRLQAGLRSCDAIVPPRCQVLLASASRERPPQIARSVGCSDQTVRNIVRQFRQDRFDVCLTRQSNRPHQPKTKVDAAAGERLRALLHASPQCCGKPTGVRTPELAAEESFAAGITQERVTDETSGKPSSAWT